MSNDLEGIENWEDYREALQKKLKKILSQIQEPLSLHHYVILIARCVMFI